MTNAADATDTNAYVRMPAVLCAYTRSSPRTRPSKAASDNFEIKTTNCGSKIWLNIYTTSIKHLRYNASVFCVQIFLFFSNKEILVRVLQKNKIHNQAVQNYRAFHLL